MAEWIIEVKDGKFPIGKWTELVRCRDCRYYMPKTHGCTMAGMMTPGESDFCSRGNRKDNSVKNYTVTCDDSCPVTLTDGAVSL